MHPLYILPWFILFLPLLAAVMITLFYRRDRRFSAQMSIGAVAASFALTLIFGLGFGFDPPVRDLKVTWLSVGDLQVHFGLMVDSLALLMCLVVAGVGLLIHIFSLGYMKEDEGFSRYFASLSLFMFSMLGIVLSNNFVQMFIFWELVGASSYLLIGFWFGRPAAGDAGKKAFITNRVGDFGFLLGILIVWSAVGSLRFVDLETAFAGDPYVLGGLATAAGLLIFCGAVGKSAQFPLHVWLPDAMEGPTPVSALIHAATMVAAGVYMLCRVVFVFNEAALMAIAWIGAVTALLAALMALQQNDIKRILAYSTLSQLGYMVMAVGCGGAGGPTAAMFHLTTHAVFKALLFLGAGSIIIALHHEQDIWRMGGLKDRMPTTHRWFRIATLALCGVPFFFAGYFSKDMILVVALEKSLWLFAIGIGVAFLTTFYMFRLYYVVFDNAPQSEPAEQAAESPGVMTVPIQILGWGTLLVGWWLPFDLWFGRFFGAHAHSSANPLNRPWEPMAHADVFSFSVLLIAAGWWGARCLYKGATRDRLPDVIGVFATLFRNKFYIDEFYAWLVRVTQDALAQVADFIDRWIIAGLCVRGVHGSTELAGRLLRLLQTGSLQSYTFLFVLGMVVTVYLVIGF